MKTPYNSPKWKALRQRALDRDNGLCMECQRNGRTTEGNIVHHIKPWKEGKSESERSFLFNNFNNLEVVCGPCHTKLHNDMRPSTQITDDLDRLAAEFLGFNTK